MDRRFGTNWLRAQSSRAKRLGRLFFTIVALVSVLGIHFSFGAAPAAAQTRPPYSRSWYIYNPGSTAMYNLGAYDGPRDNGFCTQAIVVLDFYQVDYQAGGSYGGYGVFYHHTAFLSDSEVVTAAENYALGWWATTGPAQPSS